MFRDYVKPKYFTLSLLPRKPYSKIQRKYKQILFKVDIKDFATKNVIGRGMGLAMWKTKNTYKDIQHIVEEVGEDVYTALTNPNQNICTDQECDGKLVSIGTLLILNRFFFY